QVGIATAPLFPLAAVEERLRWAGVSPSEFGYAIVSSYETMRFSKPRPEHYAELIAKMGKRPNETLMVGNDWLDDIVPAAEAGLRTYWIDARSARPPTNHRQPDGRGTLADFLRWARDDRCLESLTHLPPTPASVLAQLRGNLAAFHSAFESVPDRKRRPSEAEWSLTEITCHLRDVEAEVNLPRLKRIAGEAEPFVSAADTDPWAEARNYQSQDCERALEDFTRARLATLDFVASFPPEVWSRPARHAILGRTTSTELVSFMAEHDRIHLEQIKALA
ncbi:MAG: DinB family protein, partial [Chloroflexi bacterium]|nr:DinB family protein [Chloroflexota bacterium]